MTHRPVSSPNVDILSEVLRTVRLRGAVFYSVTASSPWVAEAPPARELAPYVMPGAEHVIEYHVAVAGKCYGGIIGGPVVRVEEGDILVFPQGDAHALASEAGMRGPVSHEFHARAATQSLPIKVDHGGSGRDPVHVVCGFLACDASPFNPLLGALPRMLHVQRSAMSQSGVLEYFMRTALTEAEARRAGGEVVLSRLSELMFVEVVRHYVSSLEPSNSGWLAGLRDEIVGRALVALHAQPTAAWTVDSLAREAGASRSALANRFVEYLGIPPMQYLAQWRMQLASSLLTGPKTLAQISGEVGYGSEAAFSRAFKKIVGVAPATWRAKRAQASDPTSTSAPTGTAPHAR
ncbi:MAG: AraC family transcriptional regulator [Labilithrix sp.]|nr:AraC family transcriptional regulator [Labilithrix sp.]